MATPGGLLRARSLNEAGVGKTGNDRSFRSNISEIVENMTPSTIEH